LNYQIHKVGVRTRLAPRDEPYWAIPLATNQSLGFRKTGPVGSDEGSWIARRRKENGNSGTHALGRVSASFGFTEARKAAFDYFAAVERGLSGDGKTVEDACKAYVEDRRTEKSEACAHDAEMRFKRVVYGTDFGRRRLDRLRTAHIKAWRNALVPVVNEDDRDDQAQRDGERRAKSSANRTLTTLKAALNFAVANRYVTAAAGVEWTSVKPYTDAGKRRDLFLDLAQRRALLANSSGAVRDLIEGVMVTGSRAGELTGATRSQFDSRTKSITLKGKTGSRTVPLSATAVKLFERLAQSKLPLARLFVRDDGKPWQHSDWDELVRAAAEAAKLPKGVCLYVLRHSWITQAVSDGLSILDVARLTGTSVMMIERHYGHLVDSVARERLALVQMT